MTTTSRNVRSEVAEDYRARINQTTGQPFAKPSTELGYTEQDLSVLPEEAVGSSFGCGNPVAFSHVKPGDTVIDLGSGAGLDLLLARKQAGPEGHVIGVDMTDAMLQRARENIDKSGYENVEVRKGVIEDLPLKSESADWVISNCVVNLSPEKDKVFSEIARALRPGGQMLISDIVINDVPWIARKIAGTYNSAIGGALSESDYVTALSKAGLCDVNIVARTVYEHSDIESMINSELGLLDASRKSRVKARIGGWLSAPLVRVAAGRVVSIRVSARKS